MKKKYHFIGIGGIGMGAIASILIDKGFVVSGSDIKESKMTQTLRSKGANIIVGHNKNNISNADIVVFSSAINESNVEILAAKEKGLLIMKRAEVLSELMKGYIGITVAGAHGKTTVTSMISNLLYHAGLFPTTAVGGVVNSIDSNASLGKGKYFVAEVDESDGSFLYFSPQYSIITNIDSEHMDYYHSFDNIVQAYAEYINKSDPAGELMICGDDDVLNNIVIKEQKKCKRYGFLEHNDVRAINVSEQGLKTQFDCLINGGNIGRFVLNVPGKHNVLNAVACISLGLSLAIDVHVIQDSIAKYSGVQRRFQIKHDKDFMVVDDYAHHPTEIIATLDAARLVLAQKSREKEKKGSLIVVFQPHRFSRLKYLFDGFTESLLNCDKLIITDVYAASEMVIEDINSDVLVEKITAKTNIDVVYCSKEKISDILLDIVSEQDIVMMLGAGDITRICDEFVSKANLTSLQVKDK